MIEVLFQIFLFWPYISSIFVESTFAKQVWNRIFNWLGLQYDYVEEGSNKGSKVRHMIWL
jgi:hypothetical protein